ncbi:serine--tRNA ligase [Candidatus Saccharibacteria bacterium]|nr:serine--tRNA ligase [Candidatus Saccharibacteria bacterium]
MLDINFIRENKADVERAIKEKRYKISLDELLNLDDERRELLKKVEDLRRDKNSVASKIKSLKGKPDASLIEKGKKIKESLSKDEKKLSELETDFKTRLKSVPNIIFDDVPLGGEEDSVEIKTWGKKREQSEAVDHLDYAISRDWVDFERGSKVAGSKFYYLKGNLALLENALIQYGLKKVTEAGFTFMTVPDLVSSKILEGCGFNPRTSDQSDEYYIEGEDLALIATAEIPLTGYHMDEILDEKDLPLCYAGLSACFRKEAGTYGKHTRGLFRVHQFNKLEMYIFCLPEESKKMHEKILSIEENIWQDLGIPYRVINIAAGDLGSPAAKKYDIEYWSPVDQKYRELTSCSNCTDFQARSLNIRVRKKSGEVVVAHTLNGTAVSLARTMVAVIENYAKKDGKLTVPDVLKPYLNNKEEL